MLRGRITLIHSCLSHILSYFLSLFRIPVSIAKRLEVAKRFPLVGSRGRLEGSPFKVGGCLQIKGARRSRSWEDLFEKSYTAGKVAMEIS